MELLLLLWSVGWRRSLLSVEFPIYSETTTVHNMPVQHSRIHSWMGIWTHHMQLTLSCIEWIHRVNGKGSKTAFTKAKYSEEDPQLPLLALHSTPVDDHLPSQAQVLFQCKLKTRLLTQSGNTDPWAEDHQGRQSKKAEWAKDNHDWWARTLLPLFAGQSISILDPARGIWIPGTVIRKLCHNLYLVKTTAAGQCANVWHSTYKIGRLTNLTWSLHQQI